jgi:ketosteroid isomerase-like protein
MTKIIAAFLFIFYAGSVWAQSSDEASIRQVMNTQVNAWNTGNIDGFMKGYWQSDSLRFINKAGITYGYNNTLSNYKKNYDSEAKMGQLSFSELNFTWLSPEYYFVTGKWFLKRTAGDVGGYYTLLFRKINGRWVIVVDHTS